jgi:hypothetical protein
VVFDINPAQGLVNFLTKQRLAVCTLSIIKATTKRKNHKFLKFLFAKMQNKQSKMQLYVVKNLGFIY